MKEILFFSNNISKIKEIKNLFKDISINVLSVRDFDLNFEPKETGSSFAENSKIKSLYGFNKTTLPCFADDSGICIEALNWKPGINSRKFIEGFSNPNECFKYILKKVELSKKNKAYFKTSICLTLKKNYHIIFEGKIDGLISNRVLGKKGFGYDPIFIANNQTKTFGEMNKKKKNELSHRSVAIKKLINFLSI